MKLFASQREHYIASSYNTIPIHNTIIIINKKAYRMKYFN